MEERNLDINAYEYGLEDSAWLGSDLFKAVQSEDENLIIGLGGIGCRTLEAILKEVLANIKGNPDTSTAEEAYPHVRLIYVDSYNELKSPSSKHLIKTVYLPQRPPLGLKERYYFYEKQWKDDFTDQIYDFCNTNKGCRVRVHLISGLSGDVGSETFLTAAYLVQEILQKYSFLNQEISGYFFIPQPGNIESFGIHVADIITRRTIQSLLKLDFCMHLPENGGCFELPGRKSVTSSPLDHYFLVPIEYLKNSDMPVEAVARFIAQSFKEETNNIFSVNSFIENFSAGSFMTLCSSASVSVLPSIARISCARNLDALLKKTASNKLPDVKEYWERADFSIKALLKKLDTFCPLDLSVFDEQFAPLPLRPDERYVDAIRERYAVETDIAIRKLQSSEAMFSRLELEEMDSSAIRPFFKDETGGNIFNFREFADESGKFLVQMGAEELTSYEDQIRYAEHLLAAAQDAYTQAFVFTKREKCRKYLDMLKQYGIAKVLEAKLKVLYQFLLKAGNYLKKTDEIYIQPTAESFRKYVKKVSEMNELNGAKESVQITAISDKSRYGYDDYFREAVDHQNSFVQDMGQMCLHRDGPAPNGEELARQFIDETACDAVREIALHKPEYISDFLIWVEPREITWRKAERGVMNGAALWVCLPEEKHFSDKWVRQIKQNANVVQVVTHRPGIAMYYGCRIHASLFDADREFDYFHMLQLQHQDAAIFLRNEIVQRLFRAEAVSEPEKVYVSQLRQLSVPNDVKGVKGVLSQFSEVSDLSMPMSVIVEEPELLRSLPTVRTLKLTGGVEDDFNNLYLPEGLRELDLSGMSLYDLPKSVTKAEKLRKLNLTGTHFKTLSANILNLSDRISFTTDGNSAGICIRGIIIDDMDPAILLGPADSIREWYSLRERPETDGIVKGLGEIKVIFLGDGEAGKTRTIQRIMADGEQMPYSEGPTQGIAISDKVWRIGDRDIKVHFWDFGGQEILYSMHRMFMTQQTVYVILLNARESTQEERANYWLYNVAHFAGKEVPVLLILNKIDANKDAYISGKELKDMYPNIRGICRLSNVTFDKDAFKAAVIEPLMAEIGKMQALTDEFPASWQTLARRLSESRKPYLRETDIRGMMQHTQLDRSTLLQLLKWFNRIGVSFFYGENPDLSGYIVLKPAWVTNAIYMILANGGQIAEENGIIDREDILNLLLDDNESELGEKRDRGEIVRVDPSIHYRERGEAAFVLGLIRYFHLSFAIDDRKEFIPVLCKKSTSPAAYAIVKDENALYFKYVYKYLPRLILHRLMVELHLYLDIESVASNIAVFSLRERGLSAAVLKRGEELHIYVRGSRDSDSPAIFLDMIREAIGHINKAFEFQPEEFIVYRDNRRSQNFSYPSLLSQQQYSQKDTVFSDVFKRDIYLSEILNPVNLQKMARTELRRDIISACLNLQSHEQEKFGDEVKCNVYVSDQLRMCRRSASTEHLGGRPGTGSSGRYGERDIVIFDENQREQYILEGLNATFDPIKDSEKSYLNKSKIRTHLTKLLEKYNPNGIESLFLLNYVLTEKEKFHQAWSEYMAFIRELNPGSYQIRGVEEDSSDNYQFIRSAESSYSVGGAYARVCHIFILMEKDGS